MERLSGLRRAQIGGQRAPHKPLLLLWLFGRFAATGSALAPYAEAADPVSRLINDFGPPVRSPALERRRAAMPFVHLERELFSLIALRLEPGQARSRCSAGRSPGAGSGRSLPGRVPPPAAR